jgi:hypothetical protein
LLINLTLSKSELFLYPSKIKIQTQAARGRKKVPEGMSLPDGERVTIDLGYIHSAYLYRNGQQHKA